MPSAEEIITALFPRTVDATNSGGGFPRRALAGTLDAASLPGRAYSSLWHRYDEPMLQNMARTGATPGMPLAGSVAEGMARDPLTLLSAPVGGLAGSGGRALASGLTSALAKRAVPMVVDAVANTGLQALSQYGTGGQIDPGTLVANAGIGLGMQGMGSAVAKMAPKGRAAIMDNPAFQKWFGGSKVADKAGNPLTVYHGTNASFDEFKPTFAGSKTNDESGYVEWSKVGPNFTSSPKYASDHAEGLGVGSVVPAHIKIENPYEITERDWSSILSDMEKGDLSADDFRKQLQSDGYDGVLLYAKDNGINSTHVIPFDPTQIKSATGNRGTFDPTDPNITHFAGGAQSPGKSLANGLAGKYIRRYFNQDQEQK